jgi:hypothetical protein
VHVFHLIGRGTGESEILERLRSKVATARTDIDAADPLENDAAVMQLLLGEPAAETVPATAHPSHERLSRPSLQREAQGEAVRLAAARAALQPGDDGPPIGVEDSAPLIARARRWQTRSNLRDRTLLLWQVAATDATGQPVQSTILAVLADRWRERCDDLRHRVELAAEPWRQAVLGYRRRFDATRRERQLAISGDQSSPASPPVALFQPGLFDGRAERIRLATIAAQKELAQDERERLRAIERASDIEFQTPRLLLVLEP